MPERPSIPDVDRRGFLNGHWPGRTKARTGTSSEIASILVHVWPKHLDAVACAIEALPGSEIYSRSPQGKLVVVIEAGDVGNIGAILNAISAMPRVLTAALVFHATDEG